MDWIVEFFSSLPVGNSFTAQTVGAMAFLSHHSARWGLCNETWRVNEWYSGHVGVFRGEADSEAVLSLGEIELGRTEAALGRETVTGCGSGMDSSSLHARSGG